MTQDSSRFVYFGLGNVLVYFDHTIAIRKLAKLGGVSEQDVEDAMFQTGLQTRFETGLIVVQQYTAEVNKLLDSDLSSGQVMLAISDIFTPNTSILGVLERIRGSGIPMGILSNTCDAHWDWIGQQNWPMLGNWFQEIVLSYEVGSMKPAEPIYRACESMAGTAGNKIFFTDDRADNIAAAQSLGWHAHQFRDADQLLAAFESWAADAL